ncbi:MAG: leucine-rich repeat protein [Eubacterium sp.]
MRKSKMFMLGIMTMGMVVSTALPTDLPTAPLTAVSVYADTITAQGKCGDNAVYKYDSETKTLTISGTGAMWDDYGFAKSLVETKKIVIEKGIQTIGSYSFKNLFDVTEVVIADTVTTIKNDAFERVEGTIEIPKSVVKVEEFAFTGAKKFVIRGDVKGYEALALGNGYNDEVVLYGDAQDLGKALYFKDDATITIAIENTKCKVSNGCLLSSDSKELYYCISARDTLEIPDTIETISVAACSDRSIKKLVLGKNVKKIGAYAFASTSIKTIVTNKKLTDIGVKAFYDTKIKNVNFRGKVKLGVSAFSGSTTIKNLKKFKYSQTTIKTAKLGKSKYNISFAKVSDAKGYQIRVKKGKKTYKYTTNKNSYTKKAPKTLTKDYKAKKDYTIYSDEYLTNTEGAAYVTIRPYKVSKGKKVYGKWSEKTVLNSYK